MGKITYHETSLAQVILKVANTSGAAHSYGASHLVDFVGLELAKIDCQALMEIFERGSKAMTFARGEEGNVVFSCKLNLYVPD